MLYFVSTLFALIIFASCNDPHEYRIDPAFTDYLQRFENEGAARGTNLTPQTSGLIMEFATLKDSTAGLTHYETPIRIEIDKTYWNAISKSAGADLMKEDLIFHELGHGLLGRAHLNTTLPNNDWKSIMCGGNKVNNRPWNINFRGVRRKYYLDELFDQNTAEPTFSSLVLPVDTTGFTIDYQKSFDNTSQAIWLDKSSADLNISLDNGRLRFISNSNSNYMVFAQLQNPISITSTFSYELTFQYSTSTNSNQFGIIFGHGTGGTTDPTEFFTISNNKKMQMGNRSWYSFYTELTESSIIPGGVNKLKVFKIGTYLYYFINNVYCYMSEIEATDSINEAGLMVPPLSTIWIDNFKISHKGALLAPPVSKINQQITTTIQKVDNFIPNKVFNK